MSTEISVNKQSDRKVLTELTGTHCGDPREEATSSLPGAVEKALGVGIIRDKCPSGTGFKVVRVPRSN